MQQLCCDLCQGFGNEAGGASPPLIASRRSAACADVIRLLRRSIDALTYKYDTTKHRDLIP